MQILLSQSYIYPISDVQWHDNCLQLFYDFYNTELQTLPFTEWFCNLVKLDYPDADDAQIERIMQQVIRNRYKLHELSLRLFPIQTIFSQDTWTAISNDLQQIVGSKYQSILSYEDYAHLFITQIDTLLRIA